MAGYDKIKPAVIVSLLVLITWVHHAPIDGFWGVLFQFGHHLADISQTSSPLRVR